MDTPAEHEALYRLALDAGIVGLRKSTFEDEFNRYLHPPLVLVTRLYS